MIGVLGLGIAWAGAGGGAMPAIDAQYTRPTIDGVGTLWTDDTHRGRDGLHLRTVLSYVNDPLVYRFEDGQDVGLVTDVLQLDLMPSVSIGRARVGVQLPMYVLANTKPVDAPGWGDARVDGRWVVMSGDRGTIGLGADAHIALPTGLLRGLRSSEVTYEVGVVVDKLLGPHWIGVNVATHGGPARSLDSIELNDSLRSRLGYSFRVSPAWGGSAELAAAIPYSTAMETPGATWAEWSAGGWHRSGEVVVRLAAGTGLTRGIGSSDVRVSLALGYEPPDGPADRDRDGVPNRVDECPRDPEDADGFHDLDGCAERDGPLEHEVEIPG